jgi:hypothetical protein
MIVGDEPDIQARLARLAAPQPDARTYRDPAAVCSVSEAEKIGNALRVSR